MYIFCASLFWDFKLLYSSVNVMRVYWCLGILLCELRWLLLNPQVLLSCDLISLENTSKYFYILMYLHSIIEVSYMNKMMNNIFSFIIIIFLQWPSINSTYYFDTWYLRTKVTNLSREKFNDVLVDLPAIFHLQSSAKLGFERLIEFQIRLLAFSLINHYMVTHLIN